jgi:hypothetical protein
MRIPETQLNLFAKRLEAIGVGRRDFLKVVGAMAAFGGLGFATEARAAKPTKPWAGEKLSKEQMLRYGGGGWFRTSPRATQQDLYCLACPHLRGLMVFNADFVSVPGWRPRWKEQGRPGLDLHDPEDSRWSTTRR